MKSAEEVQVWNDAAHLCESDFIPESIAKFELLTPNSKMKFNIGCCYLCMDHYLPAKQKFEEAVVMDNHLAIAHFMIGQILYVEEKYQEALEMYETAVKKLRGNRFVDYRPTGLNYQLHASEIFANQGILSFKMLKDADFYFMKATKFAVDERHRNIGSILLDLKAGNNTTLFSMPLYKLFKPSQSHVSNIRKKNYLGEAKVISTVNDEKIYACFSGLKLNVSPKRPEKPPKPPPPTTNRLHASPRLSKRPDIQKRPDVFNKPKQVDRSYDSQSELNNNGKVNGGRYLSQTEHSVSNSTFYSATTKTLAETKKLDKSYSNSAPRKRLPLFTEEVKKNEEQLSKNGTFPRPSKPRKPLPTF